MEGGSARDPGPINRQKARLWRPKSSQHRIIHLTAYQTNKQPQTHTQEQI